MLSNHGKGTLADRWMGVSGQGLDGQKKPMAKVKTLREVFLYHVL